MIDDTRGQEPTEPTLMDDGVERDLELQTLARIVDGILDEMGITVVAGGTVITNGIAGWMTSGDSGDVGQLRVAEEAPDDLR
jgi:hypothetical protein